MKSVMRHLELAYVHATVVFEQWKFTVILGWLVYLCLGTPAFAKLYIRIDEAGRSDFPLGVPAFTTSRGSPNEASLQLTDTLRKNLRLAGLFRLIDESAMLSRDFDPANPNFDEWRQVEAYALVTGIVDTTSSPATVEMRLFDTETREILVGKQYKLDKKQLSLAAHRFADEIMKALTGVKGPFNTRIAASCGLPNRRQVTIFSPDGSIRSALTKNKGNNLSPSWSFDGSQIAFMSNISYISNHVYKMNADGGGMTQVSRDGSLNITPVWSPRDEITFTSNRLGEDSEIFTASNAGVVTRRLTNALNIDVSPAYSPDGSQIVFASERAGNLHLFRMDAQGGNVARLTYTGYQNDQPDWAPNGQKIAFISRDQGVFDIFIMNPDGSFIERLTLGEGDSESPTWSPDGRYLAFHRGGKGLMVMKSDGSHATLIPGSAGCIGPDWGSWLP